MANETASEKARSYGLRSLAQVTALTGVSKQTLQGWHKHKPTLFAIVLVGCAFAEEVERLGHLEQKAKLAATWRTWLAESAYSAQVTTAVLPEAAQQLLDSNVLPKADKEFCRNIIRQWGEA